MVPRGYLGGRHRGGHPGAKPRPGSRVFVTGHSLGGALATLCALDLDVHHHQDVQLVTTGGPRVGDEAFAKLIEERLDGMLRVAVKGDPIAGVPTGRRYHHAGRLLFLGQDGFR